MNFLHDRPRLPSQAEIDSLYFHIWMLWIAGMLLAFSTSYCDASHFQPVSHQVSLGRKNEKGWSNFA